MPAGGWPLVVYHHGTGGSMTSFIQSGVAAPLAAGTPPMAVFGFDAVEHGARKGGSIQSSDNLVFNVLNPHAARDNPLQGASDILTALRLSEVTIPAAVTGTAVAFDPDKLLFYGHSQGSNSGQLAIAFSSAPGAAVLSGAGSGVVDGLTTKTNPINIAEGMQFLIGEKLDTTHPVMIIFQNYFERTDPLNYGPLILRRPPDGITPKHVYQSYGLGDTYSPPRTLANTAKAIGLPVVMPVLESLADPTTPKVPTTTRPVIGNLTAGNGMEVTGAVFQYPQGTVDGHFVSSNDAQAINDWLAFLQSYLLAGTPHIP
jgi:hypothetical protein